MRTILSLAALSLAALAADARTLDAPDQGYLSAICAGENLPFPIPSFDVTEDWADSEFEGWVETEWERYCARPKNATASAACACTGHKVAR